MTLWYRSFLVFLGAYTVGAVPIGPLIASWAGVPDLLERGSKSAGATNVARHVGWPYFFLVLVLDAAKAFFYLKLLGYFNFPQSTILLSAFALLIGNSYSIFLRGRGGKGIATGLGIVAFLVPIHFLFLCIVVWLVVLFFTHQIGIASVAAALALIGMSAYCISTQGEHDTNLFLLFMGLYGVWRHKQNLDSFFKKI